MAKRSRDIPLEVCANLFSVLREKMKPRKYPQTYRQQSGSGEVSVWEEGLFASNPAGPEGAPPARDRCGEG